MHIKALSDTPTFVATGVMEVRAENVEWLAHINQEKEIENNCCQRWREKDRHKEGRTVQIGTLD